MEQPTKRRLFGTLVFLVTAGVLTGILYATYHGPWDPRLRRMVQERRLILDQRVVKTPAVADGKVTLDKGQPVVVGGIALELIDTDRQHLHLGVTILELDPETVYHHRVPVAVARRGIQLGGRDFILVSQTESRIQLGMRGMAAAIQ
jgi:hypothetical protein